MNLIANTGIQFFNIPLEINCDDSFKMYFYEWFDLKNEKLTLEIAHYFTEDEIWVRKRDIHNLLGLGLTGGKVGRMDDGKFKPYKWEEIKDDFFSFGKQTVTPMETELGGTDCFQISTSRLRWEKFENRWLPFPFFVVEPNGRTGFAPTNWCRCKLIPVAETGNIKKYDLVLVFDTRTKYEDEDFEGEDLMETPVFSSNYDKAKEFAICNNEFSLVDFCSKSPYNCEWVDEHILKLFHNVSDINELSIKKPKMNYLAQYIFLLKFIQQLNVVPSITLFSEKNAAYGNVDLVVDMGNSRTCAVLFDSHDFTKVQSLALQNLTSPVQNGKMNLYIEQFDMRLAFREADFGVDTLKDSTQFVYPSAVRLGIEANELIHKAIDLTPGVEKTTTFSSPKRYLWDTKPQKKDWEFLTLMTERNKKKLVQIKGISEQLNADGTLNISGEVSINKYYSRKALMTFAFMEILAQAKMQINSYEYRHKWGEENKPRRIRRIIVTCPTAMSRVEQFALRKCAEDAAIVIDRFYAGTYNYGIDPKDVKEMQRNIQIIPSLNSAKNAIQPTDWTYDEATCSQFVYLYSEINRRYQNNCKEYFDFYGKVRNDLKDYNKKSLTIGSVDIGAGTTDLMIATYKYQDIGPCILTPVPLFWESFYQAGDDLLKNLIRKLVIEGQYSAISKQLEKISIAEGSRLTNDFFGKDNARQSATDRQIRSEFNLQVAIPVATHFLEILRENKIEKATLAFNDIFSINQPTERVLEHFVKHFNFSIKDLQWHYDKEIISKIVESTFDTLAGKISTILSYFGCDIVLLSGRPTSLKPLSDLFLKYYAVAPNRLITLNNYRIGTWYPFQDGKGFFRDGKSIVAVGAMIGNYASTRGSLDGFSLDFSQLIKVMRPTTDYFAKADNENAFITPELNSAKIEISQLPIRLWTRQLNSSKYPTRPFYMLDLNEEKIKERMINRLGLDETDNNAINNAVDYEMERLRNLSPFKFNIIRESYFEDKEKLIIESVEDCDQNQLPIANFTIQIQSMNESENYWLDSGEFDNLSINQ